MAETWATRRKSGRPKAGENRQKTILDQAERCFAADGFPGASLRDRAAAAGVNQARPRYYFGLQQNLIFGDELQERRRMLLEPRRHEVLFECDVGRH